MKKRLQKLVFLTLAFPLIALAEEGNDSIVGQQIYGYKYVKSSNPLVLKNVAVKPCAKLKVSSQVSVTLKKGFSVVKGGSFEVTTIADTVNFISYGHDKGGNRTVKVGVKDMQIYPY